MDEEKNEVAVEDTTEELIAEYGKKRRNRSDDVIATQAVVCIMLAVAYFAASRFCPDITGALFVRLRSFVTDSSEIMPNPIDFLINYIDTL